MENRKIQKQRGFTLMELIVAMTIFIVVVTAFMSLFISAFKFQRSAFDKAYLLNNGSYALEYISRALRMAMKDRDGTCIDERANYENPSGDTSIQFLNHYGNCQLFFFENNQIKVQKSMDGTSGGFLAAEELTPTSNFSVDKLKFFIQGEVDSDRIQPSVTIVLGTSTTGAEPQELDIQTTISQRGLDVQY